MSLHYTYSLTEGFREGVDGGEVKINGHVREKNKKPCIKVSASSACTAIRVVRICHVVGL